MSECGQQALPAIIPLVLLALAVGAWLGERSKR